MALALVALVFIVGFIATGVSYLVGNSGLANTLLFGLTIGSGAFVAVGTVLVLAAGAVALMAWGRREG